MKPVAEFPKPILAALRGLVFDIDDTLTTGGSLSARAYAALWELHDHGLDLVAITGRPLGWADAIAALWPVSVAVGENGAGFAWHSDGGLRTEAFAPEEVEAGRESLERVRRMVAQEFPDIREAADQGARRYDLAFDIGENYTVPAARIEALRVAVRALGLRVAVSSVHLHAIPGVWDKAQGAQAAIERVLHVDLAQDNASWAFIGDSGNDAAAFAFFENTVGVANVAQHLSRLPKKPRWVTRAAAGDGFCEFAELIVEARRER